MKAEYCGTIVITCNFAVAVIACSSTSTELNLVLNFNALSSSLGLVHKMQLLCTNVELAATAAILDINSALSDIFRFGCCDMLRGTEVNSFIRRILAVTAVLK